GQGRAGRAHRLRLGACGDPGRTRPRLCPRRQGRRLRALSAGPDAGRPRGLHRRAGPRGAGGRRTGQGRSAARALALPGRPCEMRAENGGLSMAGAYNLLIGLHIIAVIAWMAGLMMLLMLFAYHTETAPPGSEFDAHFIRWEGKLVRIILNPAFIIVWVLGL